ncbi:MAG: YdeI/OmpD-associated family protein [Aquaticitalea sp.]
MKKVNSVEEYIEVNSHFGEELSLLRSIITSTELEEHLKWSAPVYSIDGKNVAGLGAFKNHFGIWFFNGVFLKDEKNLLEQAQETTKGLRQMRFGSMAGIDQNAVLSYVKEAIENQKLGKEIKPERKGKKVNLPAELATAFTDNSVLHDAFKFLTPGKQREYADYIATAKREETRLSRLEKIKPMIIKGIGLHDKYKNC